MERDKRTEAARKPDFIDEAITQALMDEKTGKEILEHIAGIKEAIATYAVEQVRRGIVGRLRDVEEKAVWAVWHKRI